MAFGDLCSQVPGLYLGGSVWVGGVMGNLAHPPLGVGVGSASLGPILLPLVAPGFQGSGDVLGSHVASTVLVCAGDMQGGTSAAGPGQGLGQASGRLHCGS